MFYISQTGKNDCAYVCLEILLATIHKDKNYLFLKHEDKIFTFKELVDKAKEFNTELLGVKVTNREELSSCNSFPFIAVINNPNKEKHCVIVEKIVKSVVYYFDPQLGKRKSTIEDFISIWTSQALIIKSFTKTKCNVKFSDYIRKKDKVLLPIYQILSSISLLIGTFFISYSDYAYVTIVGFAVFIIFEILFRDQLLKANEHMKEEIFKSEFNLENTNYENLLKTIEEYKKSALVLLPNIICSLLIVTFISVLVVVNGFINSLYVLMSFVFALIEFFIIKPKLKEKELKLMEEETYAINAKDDYEFRFFYDNSAKKANDIGLKTMIIKYVEIAILLITSIVTMYLTNINNITYVVFYLCVSIFLVNEINKIFSYAAQKDNFDSLKAKMNNYLK